MANMIKDLLSQDQAKLLDDQLRQQSLQQGVTNYGSDPMGKFLTAASGAQRASAGFGMAAERAIAGRQMGANEQGAVQAQQGQEAEQAKAVMLQKKLANADESQLKVIIQNNIVQNPTLAKAAQEVLKMKISAAETPSIGEGSTFIDDATGNSYTVFTDDKGKQTIKPVGGNTVVPKEEIKGNLVTPNVYQTLYNAKNDFKMLDAEERKDA
jgi:hypothetical protein